MTLVNPLHEVDASERSPCTTHTMPVDPKAQFCAIDRVSREKVC
jgi:hypothetical protein